MTLFLSQLLDIISRYLELILFLMNMALRAVATLCYYKLTFIYETTGN